MKYSGPGGVLTRVNEGNEASTGSSFASLPSVTRQGSDLLVLDEGKERRNFEQSPEATGSSALGVSQERVVVRSTAQ